MAQKNEKVPSADPFRSDTGYPEIPTDEPGLVGGPATEAMPGSHDSPVGLPETITNDGGEITLSGRSRESGGDRDSDPPSSDRSKLDKND